MSTNPNEQHYQRLTQYACPQCGKQIVNHLGICPECSPQVYRSQQYSHPVAHMHSQFQPQAHIHQIAADYRRQAPSSTPVQPPAYQYVSYPPSAIPQTHYDPRVYGMAPHANPSTSYMVSPPTQIPAHVGADYRTGPGMPINRPPSIPMTRPITTATVNVRGSAVNQPLDPTTQGSRGAGPVQGRPGGSASYDYINREVTATHQPLSALVTIQNAGARVVRRGYLEKKGEFIKTWRRRYFVLYTNGQLLGWGKNPLDAPGFDDNQFYESAQYISKGPMNNFHIREVEVQTENRDVKQTINRAQLETKIQHVMQNYRPISTVSTRRLIGHDGEPTGAAQSFTQLTDDNLFARANPSMPTETANLFETLNALIPPNNSDVRHCQPQLEKRAEREPYRMHLRISHNDLERTDERAVRYFCTFGLEDLKSWLRAIHIVKYSLGVCNTRRLINPISTSSQGSGEGNSAQSSSTAKNDTAMDDSEERQPGLSNEEAVVNANTTEYLAPNTGWNSVKEEMESLAEKEAKISLESFTMLKVLGRGTFGKVVLAKEKSNGKYWAIKLIRKDLVYQLQDLEHTRNEASIIQKMRHPFLVRCMYTFENKLRICHVMEYANGGELHEHLRVAQRFEEKRARFYTAEITLALYYLHRKRIVYRDLKLENILLDNDGHILLTDFGLCKQTPQGRSVLTTLCGTPEYMSPELLDDDHYANSIDWWGLGVVLYAMLSGFVPFYDKLQVGLFEKILWMEPQMLPKQKNGESLSRNCQDLCFRLLMKDPEMRIGCRENGGGLEIMVHPWFRELDFEKLYHRQIDPPWKPDLQNIFDTRYFCQQMTSESVVLTDEEEMNQSVIDKVSKPILEQEAYDARKPTHPAKPGEPEPPRRFDAKSETWEN